jgi:hypothetical protein
MCGLYRMCYTYCVGVETWGANGGGLIYLVNIVYPTFFFFVTFVYPTYIVEYQYPLGNIQNYINFGINLYLKKICLKDLGI